MVAGLCFRGLGPGSENCGCLRECKGRLQFQEASGQFRARGFLDLSSFGGQGRNLGI